LEGRHPWLMDGLAKKENKGNYIGMGKPEVEEEKV
jgi:hypothetical protein